MSYIRIHYDMKAYNNNKQIYNYVNYIKIFRFKCKIEVTIFRFEYNI